MPQGRGKIEAHRIETPFSASFEDPDAAIKALAAKAINIVGSTELFARMK